MVKLRQVEHALADGDRSAASDRDQRRGLGAIEVVDDLFCRVDRDSGHRTEARSGGLGVRLLH